MQLVEGRLVKVFIKNIKKPIKFSNKYEWLQYSYKWCLPVTLRHPQKNFNTLKCQSRERQDYQTTISNNRRNENRIS